MIVSVLLILTVLFVPRLMQLLASRVKLLGRLGPVFLCYAVGLLLSFAFRALNADLSLAEDMASVLVLIAMPLVLFGTDLPALKRLAKPMIVSYSINIFAVIATAVAAFFIFRAVVPDASIVSGMLIGTYTGGTPNMFAIGNGLGASSEQMLLTQTSDMISGGLYFLFIISFLPRLLRKLLPEYTPVGIHADTEKLAQEYDGAKRSIKPVILLFRRLKVVLLALSCVAVAMGIVLLIPSKYGNSGLAKLGEHTALIMLIVTTLGIALSFIKKVREAPDSYSSGQYFILMFSLAMGLCFDVTAVSGALMLFIMLLFVQFGAVLVHIIFARIFRIDYQTMLITSTAGVFGPAFIIPVANSLKNDEIVLPGILCGIFGYAIGNYIGIGIGELLKLIA